MEDEEDLAGREKQRGRGEESSSDLWGEVGKEKRGSKVDTDTRTRKPRAVKDGRSASAGSTSEDYFGKKKKLFDERSRRWWEKRSD